MKKCRKVASVMLASVMTASMALAGCSSGEPASQETTKAAAAETTAAAGAETTAAASAETTEAAAEEKEPVTLKFVSWQTNHDARNQAVADAYHELNPHITVEFEYVGDMNSTDYLTKTDIMLMGGEEMDIVMAPSFQTYAIRAASGSYMALDPYFEAAGSSAEEEFNVILRHEGQTYGIPGEMKYTMVLLNKDMLDAAGLEVPADGWTWDEYAEYAKKLTSGSGADTVYGSYFHSWGSINMTGIGSAKKGSTFFNDDGSLTFDNPAFADFLQLRYNMENVDKSSTPLADVKALNMNYRDQFFNEKIAMLPGMGSFMLSDIGNEKYAHDFVTAFAPTPTWNEDDDHYYSASGNVFCVAKTTKHPQEAFDFLKFWCKEGVAIKGMFVSNEKGADRMDSVNTIVSGFTELLDMDSLATVMRDPKWVDTYEESTPSYQSQIDTIMTEETDRYLLGSQSLEDTVQAIMERGNEVLEENK